MLRGRDKQLFSFDHFGTSRIYAEVDYPKAGLGRLGIAQLVVDDVFNLLLNNEVKSDKIFTIFQVFFITV